jgi:hypothetical protein
MLSTHYNHWIFKSLGLALLALVTACGGGGGGPASRFEQISLGDVAAVRDNSTGLVWAQQPAGNDQSPGSSPSVQELLTLTDAGKDAIAENFPALALNQEIQSSESLTREVLVGSERKLETLPWLVSFSPGNLGEVRDGEPLNGAPFSSLRVLERKNYSLPKFDERSEPFTDVVWQDNLMWQLCTYGTKYDRVKKVCEGVPEAMEFDQATDLASKLSSERYGGFYGWRLPTKQELQKMLSLSNTSGSLLAAPFSDVERVTLNDWSSSPLSTMEYWTSTSAPASQSDPTEPVIWVVDFRLGQDLGGVNTTNVRNVKALVRLVRNLR